LKRSRFRIPPNPLENSRDGGFDYRCLGYEVKCPPLGIIVKILQQPVLSHYPEKKESSGSIQKTPKNVNR
jgi:hypothetical protein